MADIIQTAELDNLRLSPDENHWIYNGLDCCVTGEIFNTLYPLVDEVSRKTYEFSKALQAPILEMSLRGLLVNQKRKFDVVQQMRRKLVQLEANLQTLVKEGVGVEGLNWRSPVQLNKLFYDVMNMPVQKKRKSNGSYGPSTDREALEKLGNYFIAEPIVNHILALRDLGKSLGFLQTHIDSDGRMRTNFNIGGTDTGRFSSEATDFGTGTNLQNVTSSLRSIFVADPGMKFANLDLEQADSRNVGALCWNTLVDREGWDEATAGKYLDFCEAGDLHTEVVKMANPQLPFGDGRTDREIADMLAYRHLTYRDLAKKLGHGSNFYGQPPTMAKHAKITTSMAAEFQANYFNAFPCIPAWHNDVKWQLENMAQLTTLFGRRRFFFGRLNDVATLRKAIAHQPQSMTADEINNGILRLWRANRVQLLVTVHDSILFQFPEELEDEIVPWALETLRVHLTLKHDRDFCVPTEAMTGWNWGYHGDDNADGLKKWKGGDDRKRQDKQFKLSIVGM